MSFADTDGVQQLHPPKKVEIHFDERVVDHPVVPIRWCLSRETLAYMRQHPGCDWALVIVAQKLEVRDQDAGVTRPGDRRAESRLIIEGLRAIEDKRSFLQFRSAGEHQLTAYLVRSSTKHDNSAFWSDIRRHGKRLDNRYRYEIDTMSDGNPFSRYHSVVYASETEKVTIPGGIFAAEMKPWLRNYLKFFHLGVGEDECAGRWRILAAFTAMPLIYGALWLLIAPLSRLYVLVIGVLHFLFGGNPFRVWRHITKTATILPGNFRLFFGTDDYQAMPFYKGGKNAPFVPAVPVFVIGLPALAFSLTSFGWEVLWSVAGLVALVLFLAFFGNAIFGALDKLFKSNADQKYLAAIDRVERYVVCGSEQKKPETIELFWSGLKRSVCKPRQAA